MMYSENSVTSLIESMPAKPRLLVVDDQPINIQVMFQAFTGDYQVFMATSGEQALNICKTNPPDLVLLDVVMPGMDGYEVCNQLKLNPATRDIPVIFVTAHNDPQQETHGLNIGAVDFIAKPINPAVVRARVKAHLTLKLQSDLLKRLVFLDGLTGVYNRRYFDQHFEMEWSRAARSAQPLSLLMLDVDFFKNYNDKYGHQAGDDCLRLVASSLKNSLKRPADLVSRYGGEEFACILPETQFEDAMSLARQLARNVRALALLHESSSVAEVVTVSVGVATRVTGGSAQSDDLLGLADKQLYLAKQTGRARVCGAELGNQ